MSKYQPTNDHLKEIIIFHYNWKKSVSECYKLMKQAYGDKIPSKTIIGECFHRFENGDFDIEDVQLFKRSNKSSSSLDNDFDESDDTQSTTAKPLKKSKKSK